MVRTIEGYIMELFLIVFVYIVYKAMTYDVEKLDREAWKHYKEDKQDNGQ